MRRLLPFVAALALAAGLSPQARAQIPGNTLKIGVLTDMSGPFADQAGRGSVVAAQMAADDFMKANPGLKVEILAGDHQNKPDIGASIARKWVDEQGVDAITDLPNSAVALAVNTILAEKHRVTLASSSATSDLTGKACKPTTVQWTLDTYALGQGTGRALMKQGLNSWYFISFEYALGAALVHDTSEVVKEMGGKVLGDVKHPLGTTDFSSYLLQAQSSGAKVVALADTGTDAINAIKQAHEFGLTKSGQTLAALFMMISDIHSLGLQAAENLMLTNAFYWDRDDRTRAFAKAWSAKMDGKMPTENHAGVYSSVMAYLNAVHAANTVEGEKVVAAMRAHPIDDPLFGHVEIWPNGRAAHAMYVYKVKTPAESKGPWDVYAPVATIPADQAFRNPAQSGCPLVH